MQLKRALITISLLLFSGVWGFAQTVLTGEVTDGENNSIIGASVYVKGTDNGTVSDLDGKFSLEINETQGTLVVSFIGFKDFETDFSSSQQFTVKLEADYANLEDVVVIGYGAVKKKDLTGAVAAVANVEQISSRPVSSVQDFFQGQVAGVTVRQQGGDPTADAAITIRGIGSVNNESPLWVVDGMPYYGGPLNPNDIASVTVLKDAASASIYGAQASSGVIVVTTKKGRSKKINISVDAYAGIQQATNLPTPLTAEQQNWAYNTAADNSGAERDAARDSGKNPWGNVNRTNWVDEIFRSASVYSTNIALDGSSKNANYSASFNYQDKEGVLLGTSSKKYSLRLKTEFKPADKLQIGQNLYIVNREAVGTNTSSSYSGTIINAIYMPSAAPVYDENGSFHGVAPEGSVYAGAYGDVYNPVALLERPTTSNPRTYIDANFYGEYTLLEGLKLRSSFSISRRNQDYKKFSPKIPESGRPSEMNYLNQSNSKRNKWVWDNQITYSKSFGKHLFDVTGVYSSQYTNYEYNSVKAQDFAREEDWYQYLENAGEITGYNSDVYEDALTSAIGRLIYTYNDKYILSGSIRRDQTSRLASNNNSDVFHSVSAAWKISNESFMSNLDWLYHLKLRASWGQVGNIQSVSYYAYNVPMSSHRPTIGEGNAQRVSGYYVKQQSNSDLTWETAESYNVGLDMTLLDGKIDIVADYFEKYTKDMIMTNAADPHTGVSKGPTSNVGTVKNSGIELSLGYKGNIGEFKYSVSGNISSIKNELQDLDRYTSEYIYHRDNVRSTLYPFRSEPGHELFSYHLITCEGTFKSQKEIEEHVDKEGKLIQPNAKPGDLKFKDVNGDGEINSDDKTFKGSAFPDFTYGINLYAAYKNFDISMFLQGVAGAKLFNGYKYTTYSAAQQGYNLDNRVLDAWSESNTGSNTPMLRVDDPNANFGTNSDWYLEDASYLRMKNLTVGYNLPNNLMNKMVKGSSLRIYASCENLFTITDYTGMDPEVGGQGIDMGNYPVYKTFSGGISLKF